MKTESAVHSLAALAQASRLELFRLLVKRGPDGYTPNEIAAELDIPASTLSFHLKELTHSKLITARKEGRFIYYSPNFMRVNELMEFLTQNCCSLSSGKDVTCCSPQMKANRNSSKRKALNRSS